MPKIYESPDKGDTIYERNSGEIERTLRKGKSILEDMREAQMWGEIRRMAETNPAMKEYTDRCIELYHLLKEAK